jgi:spermidine synthase
LSLGTLVLAFTVATLSLGWAVAVRSHLDELRQAKIAAEQARAEAALAESMADARHRSRAADRE